MDHKYALPPPHPLLTALQANLLTGSLHRGVNTIRYTLANETWAINATLYQTIQGTATPTNDQAKARLSNASCCCYGTICDTQGFCNLTGFHNGTSLMLSNPHMYLADPKYTSLIEGQVPDPAADITRIDVEPNTGNGTLALTRAHLTRSNEKILSPALSFSSGAV
jgi:hypothetical protein